MRGVFKRLLLSPEWLLYILTLILEIVCIVEIFVVIDSSCVFRHEMSTPVMVVLLFNIVAIFGDLVFIILIIFCNFLAEQSMAAVYNLSLGGLCLMASSFLAGALTFCGNDAQYNLAIAAVIGIIASFLHIISGFITHFLMPEDETYLWNASLD